MRTFAPGPILLATLAVAGCGDRTLGGTGSATDSDATTQTTTNSTGATSTGTTDGPECTPGQEMGDPSCGEYCTCDNSGLWQCQDTPCPTSRKVDVLFVIDNSGSMGEEQRTLAANFGSLLGPLDQVGFDYRIGITTTDNGNPWCSGTTPEGGAFRLSSCQSRLEEFVFEGTDPPTDSSSACTNACEYDSIEILPTATDVDPMPKPHPWLEKSGDQHNVGGGVSMLDALRCVGPQGINGCGFEGHLESMYKSLRRSEESNEQNFGFVRRDASLIVLFVTDEADCSHQNAWQEIFLPEGNRVFWADPNAAFPTSAVCWNAGVTCSGGPGSYDTCGATDKDVEGNEGASDDDAVLHPLNRYRDYLEQMRQEKSGYGATLKVALIGGVPADYATGGALVYADSPDPVFQESFGIGPGCTSMQGSAVPPVRILELAQDLSGPGTVHSVCASDYSSALESIIDSVE